MVDQISADGGMHSGGHGHFKFGSDAVRAGHQHRLFPFLAVQREQRAKSADASEHARRESSARVVADALLGRVGDGDVHSGIGVFHGSPAGVSLSSRRTKLPVVVLEENASVPPGGVGNTSLFLLGTVSLKSPEQS